MYQKLLVAPILPQSIALLIRTILEKAPNLLEQTRNANISVKSNSGTI